MTIQDSFEVGSLIKMTDKIEPRRYMDRRTDWIKAYNALTSNNFSRAEPTNPEIVKKLFREAIYYTGSKGINFLVLWGGSKESKTCEVDHADDVVLKNLYKFKEACRRHLWDNFDISLLFCDAHHDLVNLMPGATKNPINNYRPGLERLAKEKGFPVIRLSDRFSEYIGPRWSIEDLVGSETRDLTETVFEDSGAANELEKAAAKHSRYANPGDFAGGIARTYVEIEIYFLRMMSKLLGNCVFASFSDPRIQKPISKVAGVPMLHLLSGLGKNDCPWYCDEPFEKQ